MNKNSALEIDRLAAENAAKLRHDLMAPICNVKAYTGEVRQIGLDLENIISQHQQDLPESLKVALEQVVCKDIDICTNALDNAAASLEQQLQDIIK